MMGMDHPHTAVGLPHCEKSVGSRTRSRKDFESIELLYNLTNWLISILGLGRTALEPKKVTRWEREHGSGPGG